MATEVCPICDIAGCKHIRERQAQEADTIARLQAELAEARAEKEADYTVGFAAGIDAGAKVADTAPYKRGGMVCGCSEGLSAWTANAIRSLTPPDVTKAAARVLLAQTDAGRDDEIGPWLHALAEGGEHE